MHSCAWCYAQAREILPISSNEVKPLVKCTPTCPPLCAATSFRVAPLFLVANLSREDLSLNSNGVPDLIVTLLLVMFALAARKAEKVAVESIDTAQQTPQDYSVGQLAVRPADFLFFFQDKPTAITAAIPANRSSFWANTNAVPQTRSTPTPFRCCGNSMCQ